MHSHCINKLINIKDVIVKKVIHSDTYVKIYLETKPSEQTCPACGAVTERIHDYRSQTIKHSLKTARRKDMRARI